MTMHMAAVNVGCDDRLSVLSEVLSDECFCYFVGKIGSHILRISKAHDIMDSFYCAFPLKRFRTAELVPGELLIDQPHLIKGLVGICGTVYRGRVQQVLGLFRI